MRMYRIALSLLLLVPCATRIAANAEEATKAMPDEHERLCRQALVSIGDAARVQHALAKARRGEPIVVGTIGGSITQGASASAEENRWPNRVAQWWRATFPQSVVTLVNAGIGATGSDVGAHRVQAHLLDKHPDFIVAEYAVNDSINPMAGETLEGLVRQILRQPNHPALMLLFTMDDHGRNVQDAHKAVGAHYRLPMVSCRDGLWPEIEAGRMKWDDIAADMVHPNDRGHAFCADFVTCVLATVLRDLPDDKALPPVEPCPESLISDVFEHTKLYNRDSLQPVKNDGWRPAENPYFGGGWETDAPGSVLAFDVEGDVIGLLFYRIKGPMGIALAQVDDRPPVRAEAWFDADWGGYTPYQLVARDLGPGKHRLRITLSQDKQDGSDGNTFQVVGILIAGTKRLAYKGGVGDV